MSRDIQKHTYTLCIHDPYWCTQVKHSLALRVMNENYRILKGKCMDQYMIMSWKVSKKEQMKTCGNCTINQIYNIF